MSAGTRASSVTVPWRLLSAFVLTLGLALALMGVSPRAPQNGLWWDTLMIIGMLAAGFLIAAPMISPRVWVHFGGNVQALRFLVILHSDIAYAALALTFVHVIGLVLIDDTVIEYLKLSAPWSMLAGLASTVLLVVLVLSSVYRRELGWRYRSWRSWHIGLSGLTLALAAFHIIDAGFFINSPIKKIAFIALVTGPGLISFCGTAWRNGDVNRGTSFAGMGGLEIPRNRGFSVRIVILIGLLGLAGMMAMAIPQLDSRAESQVHACAETVCE